MRRTIQFIAGIFFCALFPALSSQAPARAAAPQAQTTPYVCQATAGVPQTGAILYVAVVQGPPSLGTVSNAWMKHALATYLKQADPNAYRGHCGQLSANAAAQQNSVNMIEQQWTAQKGKVVLVEWTYSVDVAPATPPGTPTASPQPPSSTVQPGVFFISCSTSGGGGINTYFTGVFATDKLTTRPRGPGNGHNFFNGQVVDDPSIKVILNDFQRYLTQKGYKYAPGTSAACDIDPDESKAEAKKHKRAYEGNPCSTCGKVVETGWKED